MKVSLKKSASILVLLLLLAGCETQHSEKEPVIVTHSETTKPLRDTEHDVYKGGPVELITLSILGHELKTNGQFSVPKDSTIMDAIQASGGFTKSASKHTKISVTRDLEDGRVLLLSKKIRPEEEFIEWARNNKVQDGDLIYSGWDEFSD